MVDELHVEMTPSRIEIEPGATPVEAVVAIQNLGPVVEQYTVEVSGLDSDWYTAPVASIGLFPQDKEQVRVRFHPPRRQGLRAGAYPFQIIVRGRSGARELALDAVLDVRGFAVFRVEHGPPAPHGARPRRLPPHPQQRRHRQRPGGPRRARRRGAPASSPSGRDDAPVVRRRQGRAGEPA